MQLLSRLWSGGAGGNSADGQTAAATASEPQLLELLRARFPQAKDIQVQDVSGGCGAMYEIHIESVDFKGLSTVKQHRLVTEALRVQIKEMHGIRINTVPANA